jgi:alpha-D-xyloside xylohydrolase
VRADGEGKNWTLCLRNIMQITHLQGATASMSETGLVITPQGTEVSITL